jgi:Zn-dependent alcohol dehydrogenase
MPRVHPSTYLEVSSCQGIFPVILGHEGGGVVSMGLELSNKFNLITG